MPIKFVCVFLILVLVAGGLYIAYLESSITKLKSEILGLKHELIMLKEKVKSLLNDSNNEESTLSIIGFPLS